MGIHPKPRSWLEWDSFCGFLCWCILFGSSEVADFDCAVIFDSCMRHICGELETNLFSKHFRFKLKAQFSSDNLKKPINRIQTIAIMKSLLCRMILVSLTFGRDLKSMQLSLFYRLNGGALIAIESGSGDTVGELKQRLIGSIIEGQPRREIDLSIVFAGTELMDDAQTLADVGVCAESVIDIALILPDGLYQIMPSQTNKFLTLSPVGFNHPCIVQSNELDGGSAGYQRFLVERQSCGYYMVGGGKTATGEQNAWYWKIDSDKELSASIHIGEKHLFKFMYRGNGEWNIGAEQSDEVLTVNPEVVEDGMQMVSEKEPTNDASQLFQCRRL